MHIRNPLPFLAVLDADMAITGEHCLGNTNDPTPDFNFNSGMPCYLCTGWHMRSTRLACESAASQYAEKAALRIIETAAQHSLAVRSKSFLKITSGKLLGTVPTQTGTWTVAPAPLELAELVTRRQKACN